MSWVQNVWWKDKRKKGWRLIQLPDGFHVLVHKSFKGTIEDLMRRE